MDFEQRVQEYRQSAETQSPIWIWFKANGETLSCLICKTNLPRTSSSTTNYISHLKRHHGHFKKYNVYKEYEELSALKAQRLKGNKRKNSVGESDEQPQPKQQKISESLLQPYPANHPRHQSLVDAVGLMICVLTTKFRTVCRWLPLQTQCAAASVNVVQRSHPKILFL